MIPFVDLKAQYLSLKQELDEATERVLSSGRYALGPEVAAFENEFASYCGARHAVAVNSGTSALHLALIAAGVGRGDEVITVPATFVATVAAIEYAGAHPVFVDIDRRTCTMDVEQLEQAITTRTRAVLPVHLYGQTADMDPILEIARRRGLRVIEDAAQAHGALYKGRRAGGLGDLGCFSFYPTKNLGACGEGGAVVTDDPAFESRIRRLRDWGQVGRHDHVERGFNFRMQELQGALLRVKLRRLESWNDARRRSAALYGKLLSDEEGIVLPAEERYGRHVYHLFAIQTEARDLVRQILKEAGIETAIHYPLPVHLTPAFSDLGFPPGSFPVTEGLAERELSLPMFPELREEQVRTVCGALNQAMTACRR